MIESRILSKNGIFKNVDVSVKKTIKTWCM